MIALAWGLAALSALLLALFLARGRMAAGLFFDALALGVALGAAVAVALAPCTPPSALDHDCDVAAGRWWDEATEAELLRPAAAVPCPPRAQRPAGPLSS